MEEKLLGKRAETKAKTNWTVALAFRNITTTDSWQLWSATKMTCGSVAHVEILFKVQCSGVSCPFRATNKGQGQYYIDHGNHLKGQFHILSFAVRNTPESNVVECAVSPNFYKHGGWSFIGLNLKQSMIDKALSFCVGQLGSPYNEVGYSWNWITGWFGYASGAKYEDVKASVHVKKRSWFCSEFVCAALMRCYAILPSEINREPCTTTPQAIFYYFTETNKTIGFPIPDESIW